MTDIISFSINGCSTNADSDFTEKDDIHILKNWILKRYFKSFEFKKYNSLPLIEEQKDEKKKNKIYIYIFMIK